MPVVIGIVIAVMQFRSFGDGIAAMDRVVVPGEHSLELSKGEYVRTNARPREPKIFAPQR